MYKETKANAPSTVLPNPSGAPTSYGFSQAYGGIPAANPAYPPPPSNPGYPASAPPYPPHSNANLYAALSQPAYNPPSSYGVPQTYPPQYNV